MIKIGVTGKYCSGKDTFAEYLKTKGFEHISLSDIIREECVKKEIEVTRKNLQDIGNSLRQREGNDFLAKKALEKMKSGNKYVITSIRNPSEVRKLSSEKNFVLVNVDSPSDVRFNRMLSRERNEEDPETFEKFKELEEKELRSEDESSQKINDCIKLAKFTIENKGSLDEFHSEIELHFPKISHAASYARPGWDEYFMEMMRAVGRRGTCDRGRSGAVIVKEKRIMTTGYVGAPPKMAHCDDVGHWFKKTLHEDGTTTQHCIRTVHAEANAVAQAAKNGINIEGATIYCKMEPCLDCTKLLISSGIKRIVAEKKYQASKEAKQMLEEAGVILDTLTNETEDYAKGENNHQLKKF